MLAVSPPAPGRTDLLVRRLLRDHIGRHVGRVILAGAAMAVAAAATAGQAWLMQPILDRIFLQRDEAMLVLVPLAILALALLRGGATYLHEVALTWVGQRVIAELQKTMFAHLMRADLTFFHANPTGSLVSRFTTDVQLLRDAFSKGLTGFAKDALTLLFLLGVMFWQDWRLALIAFFVFPTAVVPIVRLGRRMRRVATRSQERIGELAAGLAQTLQDPRHVKTYGMEAHETSRAECFIEAVFGTIYRSAKIRTASRPILEVLSGLAVALVIYYGGNQVIAGETTPGTFFSFITALLLAYQPMKTLASLNASLQEGLAAADRIFRVLDSEPEIRDRPGAPDLAIRSGTVRLEQVRFDYGPEKPALHGVTLTAPAGRTLALVGPSGAGKSTVLNLIPRFYDPTGGRITIDGTDIRDVTLASLRARIAFVSQEVALLDDTVRANIAYGRPEASDAEIAAAARDAAAHDFIAALPQGYETRVGERGVRLSGGERQRIAIARAMLKDAPILLLDEATSALDSEAERQVQAALERLMRGRTVIVIAHRLSTVARADAICVLREGRVAETGTHAELLARGGLYARLHALQSATPVPDAPARVSA